MKTRDLTLSALAIVMAVTMIPFGASAKNVNEATTIWVDDDGVQASTLGVSAYRSMKEGLQAAPVGSTVRVLPGIYPSQVNVNKSLKLIATDAFGRNVNPSASVTNGVWPVIVDGKGATGDGIRVAAGVDNVTISGFLVRNTRANGIHANGEMVFPSNYVKKSYIGVKKTDISQNIRIIGNYIDNTAMDGIKIHQASNVRIVRNVINNTSMMTSGDLEQAIDFVDTANSVIEGNLILRNDIGIIVKSGSAGIRITNNEFRGPFAWTAISSEPLGETAKFQAEGFSKKPYILRNALVMKNRFTSSKGLDAVLYGWQNASFINNEMSSGLKFVKPKQGEVMENVCFSGNSIAKIINEAEVASPTVRFTNNCDATVKPASIEVDDKVGYVFLAP